MLTERPGVGRGLGMIVSPSSEKGRDQAATFTESTFAAQQCDQQVDLDAQRDDQEVGRAARCREVRIAEILVISEILVGGLGLTSRYGETVA